MTDIPLGPEGFVDMNAFPAVDPEKALTPDAYEQLHAALVEEPVHVLSESRWDDMVDQALQDPGLVETDWLVSLESPTDDFGDHSVSFDADTDRHDAGDHAGYDGPGWADDINVDDGSDGGDDEADDDHDADGDDWW